MEAKIYKIFFLLMLVSPIPAKAQRLAWTNYTTDHGLPGNEVYDILQDRSGYLWFATDFGICRFNGYEFVQPVDTGAFRGSEAFTPTKDSSGRIWFTRLDGSVWFIENDTVRYWRHNTATAAFRKKYMPVENLTIQEDGTVWLGIFGLGFLVVNPDGSWVTLPDITNADFFVFAETSGKLVCTTSHAKSGTGLPTPTNPKKRVYDVLRWRNGKIERLDKRLKFGYFNHFERGIWKLSNDTMLLTIPGKMTLLKKGAIVWQRTNEIHARQITQTPSGQILIAALLGKRVGLHLFSSMEHLGRNEGRNLLPGRFVTAIHCDPEGGWWATTQGEGVFYCKNPGMEIFDTGTGLPSDEVTSVASDGKSTVFAGFRPFNIVAIDCDRGSLTNLTHAWSPAMPAGVQTIYYDRHRRRLWSGGDHLAFFQKNRWVKTDAIAKTIAPGTGAVLWSSSSFGFFQTNTSTGATKRLGRPDSLQNYERTFSVVEDREGNVWVTTHYGLLLWRNGRFEPPPLEHPALRFQPRSIAFLSGGDMAVGMRGGGVLIRRPSGHYTHLTRQSGLSSDAVTKLVASQQSNAVLFACTNMGLSRIERRFPKSDRIEVVSVKQGLPSNQVNDVAEQSGYVWVATNKGLARYREGWAPTPMPPPVLEKLMVNNRDVAIKPGLCLEHDQNNLILRFFALHYRSEGDILYQYRLLGAANTDFVRTRKREVNFSNLAPGKYTFEVQAQAERGYWAERTSWSFVVRAAWWQTPWFWAAAALLGLVGLWLWYRSRLQKHKQELAVREKIRDLEAAALRAQINPHFIFNCLASIQYFISENDVASARRYLSRFARLVRLALHGSVDGKHSLHEEIEMLENYLALEQMRFRGRFSYSVETESILEREEIFMPPMLVQPFVENALLHGMKNKSEGGRIAVAFSLEGNTLVVAVSDNGPGYDGRNRTDDGAEPGHKSVGMMLTQRRLAALATTPGETAFSIEAVRDAAGDMCGTRVVLRIPVA